MRAAIRAQGADTYFVSSLRMKRHSALLPELTTTANNLNFSVLELFDLRMLTHKAFRGGL